MIRSPVVAAIVAPTVLLLLSPWTISSSLAFVTPPARSSSFRRRGRSLYVVQVEEATSSGPPPVAPLTVWGDEIPDIRALQEKVRSERDGMPEFSVTVSATNDLGLSSADIQGQLEYAKTHSREILDMMENHGAVVFRNFDLMKTQAGFEAFYGALGMQPCLDPLHSVSARPTINGDKNSAVYEAVNKESRKNFFIGMHNEFVGTRAPAAAAFCCFKAAETGGDFLIADGRRVFADLDPDLLEELYSRRIRYSVMELPFFGWMDNLPGAVQPALQGVVKGLVSAAINAKVDFNVEMLWGNTGYDNVRMLQARAPPQPPVVVHPVTRDPTWFCNVHSHSSKLRKDREATYGAERFEDGASQINKSDMFFGDDGALTDSQLAHLDEVTLKNIKWIKMNEGDVVLLDNYKTMHGRNVFDGTRKHAVCWFQGWDAREEQQKQQQQRQTTTTSASSSTSTKQPFFVN